MTEIRKLFHVGPWLPPVIHWRVLPFTNSFDSWQQWWWHQWMRQNDETMPTNALPRLAWHRTCVLNGKHHQTKIPPPSIDNHKALLLFPTELFAIIYHQWSKTPMDKNGPIYFTFSNVATFISPRHPFLLLVLSRPFFILSPFLCLALFTCVRLKNEPKCSFQQNRLWEKRICSLHLFRQVKHMQEMECQMKEEVKRSISVWRWLSSLTARSSRIASRKVKRPRRANCRPFLHNDFIYAPQNHSSNFQLLLSNVLPHALVYIKAQHVCLKYSLNFNQM